MVIRQNYAHKIDPDVKRFTMVPIGDTSLWDANTPNPWIVYKFNITKDLPLYNNRKGRSRSGFFCQMDRLSGYPNG